VESAREAEEEGERVLGQMDADLPFSLARITSLPTSSGVRMLSTPAPRAW